MWHIRKCWHDTAPSFYAILGVSLLGTFFTMKDHGPHSAPPGNVLLAIVEAWREVGFLIALGACFLGFRTIGTEVRKGSDDFLFTRPRSRKYFVWTGWVVGIAEAVFIVMSVALLVAAVLHQENGPFWRHLPATVVLDQQVVAVDLPLLAASVLIFAAVAFSATYFVSVLTHGRGWLIVFWVILTYSWWIIDYEHAHGGWRWHSPIPGLLVQPYYAVPPHTPPYPHLTAICALIFWIACALAFPFAAQRVFERSDL